MQGSGQPGSTGDPSQGSQVPGSGPAAPPPASWQSTPQPPSGGTAPGGSSWAPAQAAGGAPVAGQPGLFYADVPNRAIAYIIDAIILFVISIIVGIVLGGILGPTQVLDPQPGNPFNVRTNFAPALITALVGAAISGAYFIYTWTKMRGTVGMKALGMQIGDERNGSTITTNQAVTRWILLGAPLGIASAVSGVGTLGLLISLAGLVWFIALLYTTAQSPTKQGLHDKYAKTMVVKAARSAG